MKKLLLFTCAAFAFGMTTQAFAYNITHPFYTPAKGKVLTETSVRYTHSKWKRGDFKAKDISKMLEEDLSYGITDDLTLSVEFSRDWLRTTEKETGYEDFHGKNTVDDWYIGGSYNFINDGKNFFQVLAGYGQKQGKTGKMDKQYLVDGMYGYNFDWVTPYVDIRYENTLNHGKDNDAFIAGKVGVYKAITDKLDADIGVLYSKYTGYTGRWWDLEAGLGYEILPNVGVNLSGTYTLAGKEAYGDTNCHSDQYSGKLSVKVAF